MLPGNYTFESLNLKDTNILVAHFFRMILYGLPFPNIRFISYISTV